MKKLLLFVFAAFAFAACEQAPIEEQSAVLQDAPETLTVGFEGDDTRIQLNEAQKTVWTKGDQVSVFYFSDANQLWQYNGETGSRTANLKRVNAGEPTAQTTYNVVAYPFNEDYFLNTRTGALQATLPATQHYLKDSYGVGDNLMVAQSEFTQFSLKNVCGWLKLQLTGDGEVVKSITFKGNDGEQVAGLIHVDTATAEATLASEMGSTEDNNAGGNLVFDDTILTEATLDCGEGVALGKNATAFYIALPPQTFEKGFTIEITDTEDFTMEQSSDKALLIERNHIQPMAAFEFINPNRPTQPIPANNEIWYTATEKADPYFDDFLTFGSDLVSNVWDSETKMGIITFDGDVTMIGDKAFYNCDKLNTITLPQGVTDIGNEALYDCDGLTEFTIPNSVTEVGANAFYSCGKLASVTIGDSVTTIGSSAFSFCDSLTSVNIPNSVTTIGNYAFGSCSSLTEFTGKFAEDNGRILVIDGVLTAFAPAGITEYNIPDSVTKIGSSAFNSCTSLTSVNIPDSVTTIGRSAFYSCNSLTSITIPDSVTTIGESAFEYCKSLTSVNIPNSVTTIGKSAFRSCNGLISVNIPDSVTTIGDYAFWYCKSLTSVNIPDSVTSIGRSAFDDCDSLKKVYCYATIPPSLGLYVFSSNASGRRIYVYEECVELYKSVWSDYKDSIVTNGQNCPETTTIQYTTNDGNTITSSKLPIISNIYENGVGTLVVVGKISQIPNNAFQDCTSLTSVNIPDSVTTIGYKAFAYCRRLTSVNIPDSVTTIGDAAFADCDSLKEFKGKYATEDGRSLIVDNRIIAYVNDSGTTYTIPDSVTTIGDYTFYYCTSLTSVNIPDSVTSIGSYAFRYCYSLTSVYCKATTPPALGDTYVFYNHGSSRKIYVPTESVDAYKSASRWSEYASAIVGYDFENGVVVE